MACLTLPPPNRFALNEWKMNGRMKQTEGVKGPGVFQTGSETVKELPCSGALSRLTEP